MSRGKKRATSAALRLLLPNLSSAVFFKIDSQAHKDLRTCNWDGLPNRESTPEVFQAGVLRCKYDFAPVVAFAMLLTGLGFGSGAPARISALTEVSAVENSGAPSSAYR